jgi:hypothetical protein
MRRSGRVYMLAAAAIVGMFTMCNNDTGPTAPANTPPPGSVIFSDGFETDSAPLQSLTYAPGWGTMAKSTAHAHSGTHSLTSDSNKTGNKETFSTISDSTAGVQFYVMATKAEQINFIGAIARSGSSWNGLYAILGMGIGASDSLCCFFQYDPTIGSEQINIAPLQFNKWYQCRIENNFATNVITYFIDGKIAATKTTTSSMMNLSLFVTIRDELGSPGPKGYYFDDLTVYKR